MWHDVDFLIYHNPTENETFQNISRVSLGVVVQIVTCAYENTRYKNIFIRFIEIIIPIAAIAIKRSVSKYFTAFFPFEFGFNYKKRF